MQQAILINRTLLVDGPAAAQLLSGNAEVFGCPVKQGQRIVVREGKRMPFFTRENTVFEVSLGPNASTAEAVSNTIPESWNLPLDAILKLQRRPVVAVILGSSDCGKSSITSYLMNKLLDGNCKVAVIDGDLGQSDIGPSATVGYSVTSKCTAEIYDLKLKNAFFVGVTSPISAGAKTIEGLTVMREEALQQKVDFVLINTDGFVVGDLAVKYKTDLINALKPDIAIVVQQESEIFPIASNLTIPTIKVEPSSALSQRSIEKRKSLREMTYARYLKNAKLKCYCKSQVAIEPRSVLPKNQEPEKGVLLGIYGRGNKFLGIGVLREINSSRHILKVQTSVSAKPSRIVIGKVIVNEKLQEV